MEKDKVYVRHILDSISIIEGFIAGITYEKFAENKLLQNGVIRELEVSGEASKKLSDEFKESLPGIEWKSIAGMRDKLIHDYFSVDLEAVWKTATSDLPPLKEILSQRSDG